MRKNDGYVLLQSLLTLAVIVICIAAFYIVLAVAAKQNRHLGNRLGEELSYRREKVMERLTMEYIR